MDAAVNSIGPKTKNFLLRFFLSSGGEWHTQFDTCPSKGRRGGEGKGIMNPGVIQGSNGKLPGQELEDKVQMNPSERIDHLIAGLTDWRGKTLAAVRKSILAADREIIEEWKWMGSPVWSRDGIIAIGNAHKDKVKLTFAHGASLSDPDKVFNAGLGGKAWRAIDLFEGDTINERALKNLVRAAIDHNQSKLKRKAPAGTRAKVHQIKK
jgi:hypothetical protein